MLIGIIAGAAYCQDTTGTAATDTASTQVTQTPEPVSTTISEGATTGTTSTSATTVTTSASGGTSITLPSGVSIIDRKVGDGDVAEKGKTVKVHYTGMLMNGKVFDSSRTRLVPAPFEFEVGSGMAIPGYSLGVEGMRVGGQRLIHIPSHLAYGSKGSKNIPPNSDLQFEIELVGVK